MSRGDGVAMLLLVMIWILGTTTITLGWFHPFALVSRLLGFKIGPP